MYRIFLADDEDIIRDGIRRTIDRVDLPVCFCGEAPDGEMALPLMQDLRPDILITDVRMPFMDGLALAALVRRAMPWVHIIILSGHDEFEYAQRSVSIGVDAYLLKPIDPGSLKKALEDTITRIEADKAQLLARQRTDDEHMLLREHFLIQVISGTLPSADIHDQSSRFGISLLAKQYQVGYVALPQACLRGEGAGRLRRLLARLFDARDTVQAFLKGGDCGILLLTGTTPDEVRETAYEAARALQHELERLLDTGSVIGLSRACDRLSALPDALREAQQAAQVGASGQSRSCIVGFEQAGAPSSPLERRADAPLADRIRHMQEKDIPEMVDAYLSSVKQEDVQSVLYRYYLLVDLLMAASRFVRELQLDPQACFAEFSDMFQLLHTAGGLDSARHFCAEVLRRVVQCRGQSAPIRYGAEIERARGFIRKNYADPNISLHVVASAIGFSPNYFSTIFSQETGETFIEYLTKTRIEAAKAALRETDRKLSEIAFDIGYNEPQYFSYIFKKYTGLTPRDYRLQEGDA
nr:response regulator [uncultured Agathobaculum sp.]